MGGGEITLCVPPVKQTSKVFFFVNNEAAGLIINSHWFRRFCLIRLQFFAAFHLHGAVHNPIGC